MNLFLTIGAVALALVLAILVVRLLCRSRRESTEMQAAFGSATTGSESSQDKGADTPEEVWGASGCRIPEAVEQEGQRTQGAPVLPTGRAASLATESNRSAPPAPTEELLAAGFPPAQTHSQADAASPEDSVAPEQRDLSISAQPSETALRTSDALPGGRPAAEASVIAPVLVEAGEPGEVGPGVHGCGSAPTDEADHEGAPESYGRAEAPTPPSAVVAPSRGGSEPETPISLGPNRDDMPAGDEAPSEVDGDGDATTTDPVLSANLGAPASNAPSAPAAATPGVEVPLPPTEAESPARSTRGTGEPPAGPRTPRIYRPAPRAPAAPRGTSVDLEGGETRERALAIEVRLVFEKAGFCRVSLLPRRALAFPEELAVSGSGDPPELIALQDEWYQDVVLPDAGGLLRRGVEWQGALSDGRIVRWSLSGREIYVLCRHGDLNGFVSTPRLILGEEHVVLCTAERLQEVRRAIELTGSQDSTMLDGTSGMPPGWVGLRGVVPRGPVAPSPTGEILDALRPLADVEIVLEGGIRLEHITWLSGYPPRIRLRGDVGTVGKVLIDGQEAVQSPDGGYVVPGQDLPGHHQVWCPSASRSYSIREGAEDWEAWDAYTWSMGDFSADGEPTRPTICGVLVRPPRVAPKESRALVVPASNSILLGAVPGQIHTCTVRRDVRAGTCTGFPWFAPVWAIPADALLCDKRVARVLLIGDPRPVGVQEAPQRAGREHARRIEAWCSAILTARRKGLRTEPPGADIAALWQEYKGHAKAMWRSLR